MKQFLTCLLLGMASQAVAQQPNPWYLEASVRMTTESEGYFFGPAFGVGVGKRITDEVSVAGSFTHFRKRISGEGEYYDLFRSNIIDVSVILQSPRAIQFGKGFYYGAGMAVQERKEICYNAMHILEPNEMSVYYETLVLPAIRVGYGFPVSISKKPRTLGIDFKATGPRLDLSEILTQLMLGVNLRY